MDDADKILYVLKDCKNSKALTVKGDALYNLGNFEHALLNYHRAMKHSSSKVLRCFLHNRLQ
jgi:predicted negative regulator of RcsB-dependent stress response